MAAASAPAAAAAAAAATATTTPTAVVRNASQALPPGLQPSAISPTPSPAAVRPVHRRDKTAEGWFRAEGGRSRASTATTTSGSSSASAAAALRRLATPDSVSRDVVALASVGSEEQVETVHQPDMQTPEQQQQQKKQRQENELSACITSLHASSRPAKVCARAARAALRLLSWSASRATVSVVYEDGMRPAAVADATDGVEEADDDDDDDYEDEDRDKDSGGIDIDTILARHEAKGAPMDVDTDDDDDDDDEARQPSNARGGRQVSAMSARQKRPRSRTPSDSDGDGSRDAADVRVPVRGGRGTRVVLFGELRVTGLGGVTAASPTDVAAIEALAGILGSALWNCGRMQRVRREAAGSRRLIAALSALTAGATDNTGSGAAVTALQHVAEQTRATAARVCVVGGASSSTAAAQLARLVATAGSSQPPPSVVAAATGGGIVARTAATGESASVVDARADPAFVAEADETAAGGVSVRSLLCCPIVVRSTSRDSLPGDGGSSGGDVVVGGVAVLANKAGGGGFALHDGAALRAFAAACGAAVERAMAHEELERERLRRRVEREVLAFHAATGDAEAQTFLDRVAATGGGVVEDEGEEEEEEEEEEKHSESVLDVSNGGGDYHGGGSDGAMLPHSLDLADDRAVSAVLWMLADAGAEAELGCTRRELARYVLTVRRAYRPVAYHNFLHAAGVMHGVHYLVVGGSRAGGDKSSATMTAAAATAAGRRAAALGLDRVEALAMLVAALNHDVDHRGTNNAFQFAAGTAVGRLYSTSVMERHHLSQAHSILGYPGHDLTRNLAGGARARFLATLDHSILATDLATHFRCRGELAGMSAAAAAAGTGGVRERELLRGLVMTCADLSTMHKRWPDARRVAASV
ncbi:cGMP-specific 3',5'-cyclic phosphodiesterase [Cladochytrium tenue]|nr:cGMP-specific 3',5'-cyclic phosphodiesterase [Cladochytrium tenue]